jgi:hypothetical protein
MSDDQRIRDSLRSLTGPPSDPEFRARLRQEFVDGTLGGGEAGGAVAARRIGPAGFGLIGLAIAASLLVLYFVMPAGPRWDVVGGAGEGTITVGDRTVPAARAAELLPPSLPPGTRIRVEGDAMLDLATPGVISIQMAGGSSLEVPGRTRRWLGGTFAGSVTGGEVRFVTGPDFAGQRLELAAPAARVLVTGTTFAVITDDDSTCVCVLEGEVTMDGVDGTRAVVVGGTRRSVFRETGKVLEEPILPMERMKLQMLRDGAAERDAP